VSFLINTGATVTTIGPIDAATHLGIPWLTLISPSLWPEHQDFGGIGGSCVHYIQDAEYLFRHADGSTQRLQGKIAIMQPTVPPQPSNHWVPSLLGRDLLQHFRMTTDWAQQTITFE
jgi:hypothetical protein